jgi:hypothetical protein
MAMAAAVETSFSALLNPDSEHELQDSNEEVIKALVEYGVDFSKAWSPPSPPQTKSFA